MLEETILGDLVFNGFSYSEVCRMGYFEAWRLWFIIDEIKARDLEHLSLVLDMPHSNTEYRKEISSWLQKRQPRRVSKPEIPKEVIQRFAEAFRRGR